MTLLYLTKRNIKLFFKDKGLFITSLITPLIILFLYLAFLKDIYLNSYNQPEINMSDECVNFLNNLRSWMFKNVYISDKTKHREAQVKQIVKDLFNYYKEKECEQLAIDYVAGMSDGFALKTHEELI